MTKKEKASGTPEDADSTKPPRRGRPRADRGALAFRRPTAALAAATERHRSAPVHALPEAGLLRNGDYPLPAAPVQRGFYPRRPVVMPAGRFGPEPPESGGDEAPPAGTAPAPPAGVTGRRPFTERDDGQVTTRGTIVKSGYEMIDERPIGGYRWEYIRT
jgi:hypothetical protein